MSDLDAQEIAAKFASSEKIKKKYPHLFEEDNDGHRGIHEIIREWTNKFKMPLADFISWLESYPNRDDVFITPLKQSNAKTFVDFFNLQGDAMKRAKCIDKFVESLPQTAQKIADIDVFSSINKSSKSDDPTQITTVTLQLVVIANRCPPELQVDKPVINLSQLKAIISETRYFYCADQVSYVENNSTVNWDMAGDVVLTFSLTLSLAGADKLKTVKTRNNLKFALDDGVVQKIELTASDSYSQDPIALIESHSFKRA